MIKKTACVIFLCFVVFYISMSAYAENEVYAKIDEYLQKELYKTHIPGMSIVIVDKNDVLLAASYGECRSTDTPFIIGSLSKSFTAIAIMQLVEQGKIALDDSVSQYLLESDIDDKTTIRQLLNQTSGIKTYQTRAHLNNTHTASTHRYANLNYGLLGEIIEKISGTSYEKYIEENIYTPLGMEHSFTSLEEGKNNGLITAYRNYFGIPISQDVPYSSDENYWSSVSSGYLISSAYDMGTYIQMYLNNGDAVVMPHSIQTVWYDTVYDKPSNTSYGMGWNYSDLYSEPLLSHSGLVENYASFMFVLPEREIGVIMLTNMNNYLVSNQLMGVIGNGVISLLMEEEATELRRSTYYLFHVVFNCMYMIILSISIMPLLFLQKWYQKIKYQQIMMKNILTGSLLHIVYPSFLLFFPLLLGIPFFVLKSYVPDMYIVLLTSAILAYVIGLVKATIIVRSFCMGRKKIAPL